MESIKMEMCGRSFKIGDYVKVDTPEGHRIEGKIAKLFHHIPQIMLENGWCFHPSDSVVFHAKNDNYVR